MPAVYDMRLINVFFILIIRLPYKMGFYFADVVFSVHGRSPFPQSETLFQLKSPVREESFVLEELCMVVSMYLAKAPRWFSFAILRDSLRLPSFIPLVVLCFERPDEIGVMGDFPCVVDSFSLRICSV